MNVRSYRTGMQISGAVALVTGANRGLGRQFAIQLRERGAKVYDTARHPDRADVLQLDITDPASVGAAARAAGAVPLLVNNAGVAAGGSLLTGDLDGIRAEMDTHFWGTLGVIRAFAPRLAGGAILNVLSALSWFASPGNGGYAAAKAAQWNLTNAVRLELAPQRTQVTGVHLGAADTDMMAGRDVPPALLSDPAVIVRAALDGLEAGQWEVLADPTAMHVKAGLAGDPRAFYGPLGARPCGRSATTSSGRPRCCAWSRYRSRGPGRARCWCGCARPGWAPVSCRSGPGSCAG